MEVCCDDRFNVDRTSAVGGSESRRRSFPLGRQAAGAACSLFKAGHGVDARWQSPLWQLSSLAFAALSPRLALFLLAARLLLLAVEPHR